MSIVSSRIDTGIASERQANRYNGVLLAVGASLMMWSGIGAGIWGLVSLFG